LDWAPDAIDKNPAANQPDTPDFRPALAMALEERLGLKLEAGKSDSEVLVVHHAERASEN
jgi:uncharacterized protein (TIGR03435 family)